MNQLEYKWYPTKSEAWAESAAENYVMGIKSFNGNMVKLLDEQRRGGTSMFVVSTPKKNM